MKNKDLNSEALRMFCDTDNEYKPYLNDPFIGGDVTYATDGHFLAFANNDVLNIDLPENEDMVKKCINILPKPSLNIPIPVKELKSKVESVLKIDGFDLVQKECNCNACDGSGYVDFEFEHELETHTKTDDCPVCDGDGKRITEIEVLNGKKVLDPKALCRIDGSLFYLHKIFKLIAVAELLNVTEVILISHESNGVINPILIKIGDITVLLADCYSSEDRFIGFDFKVR